MLVATALDDPTTSLAEDSSHNYYVHYELYD